MVVPEEREGRTGAAMMLSRDPSKAADAVSTRIAGGQEGKNKASRKVNAITDFYLLKHEPQGDPHKTTRNIATLLWMGCQSIQS